jgi:hypothetical protein
MRSYRSLTVVDRQGSPARVPNTSSANQQIAAPTVIFAGIRDLMLAFASGPSTSDGDMKHLLSIYAEAVFGFDPAVADCALKHLKFNNPRNPFRPTPQDVREVCQRVMREWRKLVLRYFTEREDWDLNLGSPPLTRGCPISDALVKAFLSEWLEEDYLHGYGSFYCDLERILQIPEECFASGQRNQVLRQLELRDRAEAADRA